jgi:phosphoglycerate dehydrogenase-like enzyme
MGVGFDCIDIAAATELGIVVTITPGVLEESVAEHTMAMMFAAARDLLARDAEVRRGDWSRKAFPRLSGKTIGLIGLGRIGRAVAAKSRALGMNVLATDPAADATFAAAGDVRLCSLDELLAESDVVSLHVPATAQTIDLIDAAALGKMKPRAILINTSRGALVDEDALADAMQSGHLLGAALDVFKTEPLPTGSPLMKLDRVLLCTHMGGLDEESVEGMSRSAAESIARLYRGDWPAECVVNPDVQAGFRW